ncbi:MAG: hypothetical protein HC873_22355 [Leptolyngbyaceae cyanobacterium SL_1_1]|nr:hypothetical protein [Leptolyngbyaceae cyanobacterium SL_1_1]
MIRFNVVKGSINLLIEACSNRVIEDDSRKRSFTPNSPQCHRANSHLENCCLRLSANVSYEQAAGDVFYLTGIRVAAKTQQRLV